MKKVYLHIQVLKELKQELEDEAKQKGLSLNAYIITILIGRDK